MILQPLGACSRSPWGRYMARITIMARWLEPGCWVICKNVRGLHSHITVLAVSKGVAGPSFRLVLEPDDGKYQLCYKWYNPGKPK